MKIGKKFVGPGRPVFLVAEMSGNHNQSFEQAQAIVRAAAEAGADAVKLQTYTADTLTIDCDAAPFRLGEGTLWAGRNLHALYREAFTPWEWQPGLKALAEDLGMELFSTPFDDTAVDFLEAMDVPAHKVASFEIVDHALLAKVARTGKPVVLSTGMSTLGEIDGAVRVLRENGCRDLVLLKCTSAYPADPADMNLRTIPHLAQAFDAPAGLSDHTLGCEVAVAAVPLGACLIEKHFTLSRSDPGPDSAFSLQPDEFAAMVRAVRTVEAALGRVSYALTKGERASLTFRRSLFVVADVRAGETFTPANVRSIRPGMGLPPALLPEVLGRRAAVDIARGTPVSWDMVAARTDDRNP